MQDVGGASSGHAAHLDDPLIRFDREGRKVDACAHVVADLLPVNGQAERDALSVEWTFHGPPIPSVAAPLPCLVRQRAAAVDHSPAPVLLIQLRGPVGHVEEAPTCSNEASNPGP